MWSRFGFFAVLLFIAACHLVEAPVPAGDKVSSQPLLHHRLLFMHRSVGGNLIRHGDPNMYEVLAELNADHGTTHQLWHHFVGTPPYWSRYYDGQDQQVIPNFGPAIEGPPYGTPEHWRLVFCDDGEQYVAARDSLDNFQIIAFKSGYDNTIPSASTRCDEWREQYNAIKHSEFFRNTRRRLVVMGFPPIREGFLSSNQADADSARAFCCWLEKHWAKGRGNLYFFPMFDLMAGEDNWLKDEYEMESPNDSHPNALGSDIVGRALITFMHDVARHPGPVQVPEPDRQSLPVQ